MMDRMPCSGRGNCPPRVGGCGHFIMTRDELGDTTIRSEEAFEAALAEVIERAIEGDVDVRGAWEFRTNGSAHTWDVVLSEVVDDD